MARRLLTTLSALSLSAGAIAQGWPYLTYKTAPFQPPQLNITTSGAPQAPGYLFIGPRGNQAAGTAALIYDQEGNLVYQGPDEVTSNFKVQKLHGKDVLTFWAGDMMSIGYGYGTVHILDDTYKEIYTVTLDGPFLSPNGSTMGSYIDLHESKVTNRNTLLVTAYNVTEQDLSAIGGPTDGWMLDGQFYEIDIPTNKILFRWSALENIADIPFNGSHQGLGKSGASQEDPWDAYHINSITETDEGYMVSLRHFWSGYYLYRNGTIKWQLDGQNGGSFNLGTGNNFSWQHDIRVDNETSQGLVLTMFNNANTPTDEGQPTTGLSMALDLVNWSVSNLKNLSDPSDEIHSVSQGSYEPLDNSVGHVVMDYGSIAKVKEYDAVGNTIMTAQFGPDNDVASYRGYKAQWVGTPFWKPAVVIEGNTVYMSWNGATEYDNWAVYGAQTETASNKTLLGTVARTGFESSTTLKQLTTQYIQVVARRGTTNLGYSDMISTQ
ncbi:hypothetical protein DTO166G4_6991 [Paecilomyces variotii]|nr:hypothetical protein DTO164E3_3858 [Paecilomyces variotii]KAJ9211369.1 hypothetical protein DTO166G4_6991 [Paecilomyces variotii]KAJ9218613.1 hypothetical protein DTO169C6_9043 [Paecilomyces variotii]KAJ9233969.1 hypothetical protein DTO166G5_5461 [Paecilomyces variotii]KAJ9355243.1 hypothetical protein DTO027B9_4332 [Paecilomyces variotii]